MPYYLLYVLFFSSSLTAGIFGDRGQVGVAMAFGAMACLLLLSIVIKYLDSGAEKTTRHRRY